MAYKPKTEFAAALRQVCAERSIEPEVVFETIREAVLAAYKRDFGVEEDFEYAAEVDEETGAAKLFSWQEGKKKKTKKEVTPPGFGRIAATVARQVLLQKIREAEKGAILEEYSQRIGTLVNGMVIRFDGPNVIIDIGKTEAIMPSQEQVRAEDYKVNQRLTFYIEGVADSARGQQQVIVSRAHSGLVEGLFKREVPEVSSGSVKIKIVAREAGARSKVAVSSTQAGVDPVGSCVGQKGVRVQAVINELNGEKIDIIQHSDDPIKFITASLAPAEKIKVKINEEEKTAVVSLPDDQLSLAIGKGGQNVRLAVKLTGYKIDIKEGKSSVKDQPALDEKKEIKKAAKKKVVKKTTKKKVAKKKKVK